MQKINLPLPSASPCLSISHSQSNIQHTPLDDHVKPTQQVALDELSSAIKGSSTIISSTACPSFALLPPVFRYNSYPYTPSLRIFHTVEANHPCRVNPSFSSSNISSNAKTPHSRVPSPLHVPVPVLIVFAPRTLDRAEESRQHHPHLPVELPGRCLYHSSPIFPPKATRRSDISCNSQIPRKSSILYDSLARIIILMADSSLQIQKVYPRSPRPTSLDKVDLGQQ